VPEVAASLPRFHGHRIERAPNGAIQAVARTRYRNGQYFHTC
jgi:hypothetical protein